MVNCNSSQLPLVTVHHFYVSVNTYLSVILTAYAVFQEKQRFLTDVLHEVMLLDGLASSHPVSQEVQQASDIDRVFDWIAYKKVRLAKLIYVIQVCQ